MASAEAADVFAANRATPWRATEAGLPPAEAHPAAEARRPPAPRECPLRNAGLRDLCDLCGELLWPASAKRESFCEIDRALGNIRQPYYLAEVQDASRPERVLPRPDRQGVSLQVQAGVGRVQPDVADRKVVGNRQPGSLGNAKRNEIHLARRVMRWIQGSCRIPASRPGINGER